VNLLPNLRYTFRQITKNPGFFALAVVALALGIGANTAIFSAVEAVLLRSLPYSQPDLLMIVWEDMSYLGFANNTPAPANYLDWKAQNRVFTDMASTRFVTASLTGDGQPEQLSGKKVTPNFFDVLGVQPVVGRPFTAEEDKSQSPVVVLSYNLWRRRFGGDESILGRSILLNGVQTKVVGVMPKDFFFSDRKNSDYWVPMAFTPEQWAAETRRDHAAGAEEHGACRAGPAKTVSGIERETGRRRCPDSKRICGRLSQRTARAASRFPVCAADRLFESGEFAPGAIDGQKKGDCGPAGDGCIPVADRFAVADRKFGAFRCGRIAGTVGRTNVLERIRAVGAGASK
jgi:hypothetical protein